MTNEFKDEYKQRLKQYRSEVQKYTRKQPLFQLENYEKRGKGSFHLDHIVSIKYGFDNGIEPELIGNIANLRYLYWNENISKRNYLTQEGWDVISYFINEGML